MNQLLIRFLSFQNICVRKLLKRTSRCPKAFHSVLLQLAYYRCYQPEREDSRKKKKRNLVFKESAFTDVSHKTAKKSSRVIVRDYLDSARSNAERKLDRQWSSFIFDFSYWSSELT